MKKNAFDLLKLTNLYHHQSFQTVRDKMHCLNLRTNYHAAWFFTPMSMQFCLTKHATVRQWGFNKLQTRQFRFEKSWCNQQPYCHTRKTALLLH